mgnify:CR=1 FL=1
MENGNQNHEKRERLGAKHSKYISTVRIQLTFSALLSGGRLTIGYQLHVINNQHYFYAEISLVRARCGIYSRNSWFVY